MAKNRIVYSILSLTCLTFACGESDGEDTGSSADGTSSESGTDAGDGDTTAEGGTTDSGTMTGDGDGDGSTGDGDGDGSTGDGDGDGSTGDGDGDGSTGDGDGDGSTGDGDGDGSTGDGSTGDGSTGDGDGDGSTGDGDGSPGDDDMDGIPNDDDPFPNDPDSPGVGQPNVVYAHTSSTLFTMDVDSYQVNQVAAFTFNSNAGQITDIALDRWGVLYAVSFNDVFVCDATTAACTHLGALPQQFNGMTMVPPGVIDPSDDTLIGIAGSGDWYRIDAMNGQATVTLIGAYGGTYTNSGDVFSIQGVGTYGAVNGTGGDVIVVCDPATGAVQSELANTTGYSGLYGLAGWQGSIFGFNSGGEIIRIDPGTGVVTEVADTGDAWWGAGVFSILPE
jgi:hypothetical protein